MHRSCASPEATQARQDQPERRLTRTANLLHSLHNDHKSTIAAGGADRAPPVPAAAHSKQGRSRPLQRATALIYSSSLASLTSNVTVGRGGRTPRACACITIQTSKPNAEVLGQ